MNHNTYRAALIVGPPLCSSLVPNKKKIHFSFFIESFSSAMPVWFPNYYYYFLPKKNGPRMETLQLPHIKFSLHERKVLKIYRRQRNKESNCGNQTGKIMKKDSYE